MTKEVNKKESLFAVSVAGGCAAALAFMALSFLGLSKPSEETSVFFLQVLLYGCIFQAFYIFTSRFFKWLYSQHGEKD
jgi:hypothetical protein